MPDQIVRVARNKLLHCAKKKKKTQDTNNRVYQRYLSHEKRAARIRPDTAFKQCFHGMSRQP